MSDEKPKRTRRRARPFESLAVCIEALGKLSPDQRDAVLRSLAAYYNHEENPDD